MGSSFSSRILGSLLDKRFLRAYALVVVLALYAPLAAMLIHSFNENPFMGEWRGFTLKWYQLVLADSRFREALFNSVTVAMASATLSVLLGFLAGLATGPGRVRILDYIVYPVIVMPEVAEAVALFLFYIYIKIELGWLTVMLGHTAFNVAFAYTVISASGLRHPSLEDAARTLGARPHQVLVKITLPLSLPVVVAAFAVTFILSFTNFVKTVFTKGPGFETLPLLIWARARRPGIDELASPNALNALASLVFLATLAIAIAVSIAYVASTSRREVKKESE
ncbi:MAG: ABC transporter permease [Acidilobaceae archaeon]